MKQDVTLADYIKRTTEELKKEQPLSEEKENENDYKVYPEHPIDSDYKRNPFSRV